jgi:hypothetical protein
VADEALGDGLHRKRIRKQELDGGEAGAGGPGETVEERRLIEHHRQIGGESGA